MAVVMPSKALEAIQNWEYWDRVQLGVKKEYGMPKEEFDRILPEYLKYMGLVAHGYTRVHMFSVQVDKIWHAHILNTLLYEHFCFQIFGRMIHHIPFLDRGGCTCCGGDCKPKDTLYPGDEEETNEIITAEIAAEQFRNAYEAVYGELPPSDIWDFSETDGATITK